MKKLGILLSAIFLLICSGFVSAQQKKTITLNVATFNLRLDTEDDGENAWPNRKEFVKSLIRFHDFDVFGTQEGYKHQLDDILKLDGYAYVGVGRDDGIDEGEHSAIFFKTARFEVLDKGNFWYSKTPEVPSKGWDAFCCNRLCSWGKFKDKSTGKIFFVFNSHFDHIGHIARKNSSLLLLKRIGEIAGNSPVFCTGDFNSTPDAEPIQIIAKSGKLFDSYHITKQPPYGTVGTFNSFSLNSKMDERIDYIWVTSGITINKYGVLNEQQYGRFASDHFPVMVSATF
jgi:endonuclease/exonuclease/phosphatase family metal-dependent hydrolase